MASPASIYYVVVHIIGYFYRCLRFPDSDRRRRHCYKLRWRVLLQLRRLGIRRHSLSFSAQTACARENSLGM
ncbi:hypothetical protein K505DRAFT_329016, partial [Melanomma pulvis-pyrius CBS 109.77]